MTHNTLKKILSLFLVICMMVSFAGCIPGEEDPTFATEIPTESPVETFVDVMETVYAISTVNVRSGPSTVDIITGSLSYGESIQRTGIGSKGWSCVIYNGEEAYVYTSCLSTTNPAQDTSGYPKIYSDATCEITISKE